MQSKKVLRNKLYVWEWEIIKITITPTTIKTIK